MDIGKRDTTYLLFMRWALVNALFSSVIALIWHETEWLEEILRTDTTYVCRVIIGLFLIAFCTSTWKLWKTSRELNIARTYTTSLKNGNSDVCKTIEQGNSRLATHLQSIEGLDVEARRDISEVFRMTMEDKIAGEGNNIERLTMLGLIGTVIGMVFAMKGFDPNIITDTTKVVELFKTVPPGLHIAINTTLLGSAAAFWLHYLFEILENGTSQLVSEIIKAGVYRGNA